MTSQSKDSRWGRVNSTRGACCFDGVAPKSFFKLVSFTNELGCGSSCFSLSLEVVAVSEFEIFGSRMEGDSERVDDDDEGDDDGDDEDDDHDNDDNLMSDNA